MPKKSSVDVSKLAEMYASGQYSRKELAGILKTSPNNITNIIRRKSLVGSYSEFSLPLDDDSDIPKVPGQKSVFGAGPVPGISKEKFSGQVVAETGDYVCVPTELWNLMCAAFASITYKNKALDTFKEMAQKLMELVV